MRMRNVSRWWTAGALAAAQLMVVTGCGDVQGPTATLESVAVQPNPHNVISAVSVVTGAGFDSAFVRYWQEGGTVLESPPYAFEDGVARVPVLGLFPSTTYLVETSLVLGDSIVAGVDTVEIQTDTLPDWIPAIGAFGTDTTPGFVLLSLPGGPLIVDNTGRVVWYKHVPDGTINNFQAHPNGRYTLLGVADTGGRQFTVLDELGNEERILGCAGYRTRAHEARMEADGSVWLLCNENRIMDLTAYGGFDSADVIPSSPNVNFTHGNALDFDADGNLLLCFRALAEVTKVDRTTGEVIWRFGGKRNEFTVLSDPDWAFMFQHGLRSAGAGWIQLFDNRANAPSRFIRYLIDPEHRTAVLAVDFRDAPDSHSRTGGSTQYLSNGHTLISFGRAGRVVEVDETGSRAWELTGLDGIYAFRAQRVQSLYRPGAADPTH